MTEALERIDRLAVEAPSRVVARGSIFPLRIIPYPIPNTSTLTVWVMIATDAGLDVSRQEVTAMKTSDNVFTLELYIPESYDESTYFLQFGSEQDEILCALEITVIDQGVADRIRTFNEGLSRRAEASQLLERGEIRSAIQLLIQASQHYFAAEELRAAAEVHLDVASLFVEFQNYESAYDSARQALVLYRTLEDWRGVDSAHELMHLINHKRHASEGVVKRDEGLPASQSADLISALLESASPPVLLYFAAHGVDYQSSFERQNVFDKIVTETRPQHWTFRSPLSEKGQSHRHTTLQELALDICRTLSSLANERPSNLKQIRPLFWDPDTQLVISESKRIGQAKFGLAESSILLASFVWQHLSTPYLWIFFDVFNSFTKANLVRSVTSPPLDLFREFLEKELLHREKHGRIRNLTPSTFGRSEELTIAACEYAIAQALMLRLDYVVAVERER